MEKCRNCGVRGETSVNESAAVGKPVENKLARIDKGVSKVKEVCMVNGG